MSLLPGLPLDMGPMAVLCQPDRRHAPGSRCDARSGRCLLETLPFHVGLKQYRMFLFLHARVYSCIW